VNGWLKPRTGGALFPIPTGLRPPAQGCPVDGTTLGTRDRNRPQPHRGCGPDGGWRKEWRNPVGVGGHWGRLPRVARRFATLGWSAQPRWGWARRCKVNGWLKPRVARALFPIPTGLRPPAQGCPVGGTTLGKCPAKRATPTGLCPMN